MSFSRKNARLTEIERTVLLLRCAGFDRREIAEIRGMSVNTVSDVMRKARMREEVVKVCGSPFRDDTTFRGTKRKRRDPLSDMQEFLHRSGIIKEAQTMYEKNIFWRIYKHPYCKSGKSPLWIKEMMNLKKQKRGK